MIDIKDKKFTVETIICEYVSDGSNDVLFIKKTYEMCKGRFGAIESLKKQLKDNLKYIEAL